MNQTPTLPCARHTPMDEARRAAEEAAAAADREEAEREAAADRAAAERDARPRPATAVQDWRHRAACRDEDPELHFPVGTGQSADRQAAQAKEVCRRCPVAADCLAWAVETGQEHGVWGGRTEAERRALYGPVRQRPTDTVTSDEAGRICGYSSSKSFTERVGAPNPGLPRLAPAARNGRAFVWDRTEVERFAAALRNERERWDEERPGRARAGAAAANARHHRALRGAA